MRGVLFALIAALWACSTEGFSKSSFMPENDLYLEDSAFLDAGVSQTVFNNVIDKIYSLYAPIFARLGGSLVIERRWSDSTVNAYAYREGSKWVVTMFGGLARRPEMSEAGFALVLCHELGHHVGGYPFYEDDGGWAAVEGQSDAYGAQACLQKYFEGVKDDVKTLSSYAVNKCKSAFSGQKLRECYHRMVGSKSCADLLAILNGERIRFETPSNIVVRQTMASHPPAQCRLDQYVASSICTKTWNDGIIPTEANHYSYNCERVKCWFRN